MRVKTPGQMGMISWCDLILPVSAPDFFRDLP
jgi:hypothetical protein